MQKLQQPKTQLFDPQRIGGRASKQITFGEFNRYMVYAVHTSFQKITWFVVDSETKDEIGESKVIRQKNDFYKAVEGLE